MGVLAAGQGQAADVVKQRQEFFYIGALPTYTSPHWPYGNDTFNADLLFKRCGSGDTRLHLPNALASYTLKVGDEVASSSIPGSTIEGWMRFTNSMLSNWNIEGTTPDGTILHTCGPAPCQVHVGVGQFAGDRSSGKHGTYIATQIGNWIDDTCVGNE